MKKNLVEVSGDGKGTSKVAEIFDSPGPLATASSDLAWQVLNELAEEPRYPNDLANELDIHEQKIYYHIRRLREAGLIEVVREENRHGATAKVFAPVADAFGFELPGDGEEIDISGATADPVLREFFSEFVRDGEFDGSIVVGSPDRHGPYDTEARDGHYPSHLALFLGSLCSVPDDRFVVKLDTEVKAESSYDRNMILVGGPIVNTVTSDLMEHSRIEIDYDDEWVIRSERTGKTYDDKRDAVIAKMGSPWNDDHSLILLAGLKHEGTKTCIIALTQYYEKLLEDYSRQKDFYRVVRGMDRDGDGKVDDVEILE